MTVSLSRGYLYSNCGWQKGSGCTWKDASGTSIFWVGYPNASAQEKLNITARLITEYGAAVIIRLGDSSASIGHSLVAVGLLSSCDCSHANVTISDILVLDPADGKIRNLSELQSSSYWHGGVQGGNDWSLLYSLEYPQMEGFKVK